MKTPDYALIYSWQYSRGLGQEPFVFAAGSFVRPIDKYYLPKHVLDSDEFKWHNRLTEVFCFTHFGIIPIPWAAIRMV